MSSDKTLYIVGAGASKEVNLPTGDELKNKIAEYLNMRFELGFKQTSGDGTIAESIRTQAQDTDNFDITPHFTACRRIHDGLPQAISIDNFIDMHNHDKSIEFCGKLGIVRAILEAEKRSLLYINKSYDNKINFSSLDYTWYASFFKLLTENCRLDNLSNRLKSVAFIVFNYDRCIEQYLYYSFQNTYGITPDAAAKFVNEIEIFHPYGVVGNLPWQEGRTIEFGAEPSSEQLLVLVRQIKTFTESTDPKSSDIQAIRQSVHIAHKIVFLGFAFHALNLELIKPTNIHDLRIRKKYFGTAKGISASDCAIIESEIRKLVVSEDPSIYINNNLTCSELFKEYWRSLSLT